jgi:multidrug efflux pump subunit AcrB
VVPPQVVVRAQFPGANPRVIAETVATPLEEQINGVENMLYMNSQATADGVDDADRQLQDRHQPGIAATAGAEPRQPRAAAPARDRAPDRRDHREEQSPNLTMVVHLVSPDNRYDALYLRNYAALNVRDRCCASPASAVQTFGSGDYAMRVWLDPGKLAARSLTSGDVVPRFASRTRRSPPAWSARRPRPPAPTSSCRSTRRAA